MLCGPTTSTIRYGGSPPAIATAITRTSRARPQISRPRFDKAGFIEASSPLHLESGVERIHLAFPSIAWSSASRTTIKSATARSASRLNHQIEPALFRALSALLLFVPETPLLFMGQEWACQQPFLYFTDHHADLGRLVTKGRREEFSRFEAFADPVTRARIPDPQASSTFEDSRLVWNERNQRTACWRPRASSRAAETATNGTRPAAVGGTSTWRRSMMRHSQ